jgi:hypothetical protein
MFKRLLVGLFSALTLLFLGAVDAQAKLPCNEKTLFRLNQVSYDYNSPLVTAVTDIPAVFPNPSSTKTIDAPFFMNCRSFTAKGSIGTFLMNGDVIRNFGKLINREEQEPYNNEFKPGRIPLLYFGYYTYPNIREDWNQGRVYMEFDKGKLVISEDDENGISFIAFKDCVVAVRVNHGVLKPMYFNNQITQVRFGPSDLVEFYLKGVHIQFEYMALNFKKGIIIVQNGVKFPSK